MPPIIFYSYLPLFTLSNLDDIAITINFFFHSTPSPNYGISTAIYPKSPDPYILRSIPL